MHAALSAAHEAAAPPPDAAAAAAAAAKQFELPAGTELLYEDGKAGPSPTPLPRRLWCPGPSTRPRSPSRTNWTRLVPPSVLTGHVSSLLPY